MTKKEKELIGLCEPYEFGTPFDSLYIIKSDKAYRYCGNMKNGFDRIYLVCVAEGKHYLAGGRKDAPCDVVDLCPCVSVEVPSDTKAIHVWKPGGRLVINEGYSTLQVRIYPC